MHFRQGLEHKAAEHGVGKFHVHLFAAVVEAGRRRAIGRGGAVGADKIQQLMDADVFHGRTAHDRVDRAGGNALAQTDGEFLFRELAGFKILFQNGVVAFGHFFHQAAAHLFRFALQVRRQIIDFGFAAVIQHRDLFHAEQIDDGIKTFRLVHRKLHRHHAVAVRFLGALERRVKIRVFPIFAVDEKHSRRFVAFAYFPGRFRADFNAGVGIQQNDCQVGYTHAAQHFTQKVGPSGQIQNVHFIFLPIQRQQRGADGHFAFDFIAAIVRGGGPFVDTAKTGRGAGGKEHGFRQRGLACGLMGDQTDITNIGGTKIFHGHPPVVHA